MHPDSKVTVDAYIGLGSRYSYLAFTQIARIETEHHCHFRLLPISSVELMALRGVTPFTSAPPSGQYDWDYRRQDAEAWAAFYGVPYREPEGLPDDHRLMARACAAAGNQGALRDFTGAVFTAVFAEGRQIDAEACEQIATGVGLNASRFTTDLHSDATAQQIARHAQDAADRGAFGVPTFFLGERMFWGNDRLSLLEHALSQIGSAT